MSQLLRIAVDATLLEDAPTPDEQERILGQFDADDELDRAEWAAREEQEARLDIVWTWRDV